MSNNKMKGLLKGLRYISQIFDNEKEEPEMQIGYPTDVKHVAHIGWDGPSVNQPSWMNEFKAPPGSAPVSLDRETKDRDDGSVKLGSEDSSSRKGTRTQALSLSLGSPVRDTSALPKSSRRRSSTGATAESPTRDKSDKPKQRRSARTAAKELLDGVKPSRHSKDPNQGSESPSNLPDIPKKSRRKKSKDGSTRSRARAESLEADGGAESPASVSKSRNKERCHSSSGLYPFEDDAEKGYGGIS